MPRRVTAVILAGGASTRFGSDKTFALWQGRTFLARVADAVRGVTDALFVLAPAGAHGARYADEAPGATVVPDQSTAAGPIAALRGVMDLVRTPTVLVASVDAPGLPAGLARRLVATCEELRRPAVAAPASGPLFSLFAMPRVELVRRLALAERLEDVLKGAELVPTDADGLNVNEPPPG